MTTNERTVFIVDDDADLRDALSMLMRAVGLRAEAFASARDFLHRYTPSRDGCLVLDVRMPEMSGIELQAELHKRRLRLPIVFLSAHGDLPLAVKAMKDGAFDYIQKPLDEHRLVMAVMNALNTAGARNALADHERRAGPADVPAPEQSPREREVLELLLRGQPSRAIAGALNISLKTVEFHRANIRGKFGVASTRELLARMASRSGSA